MISDLMRQLAGDRLVTALIIYRMPDYLDLFQEFVWQEYDQVPELPRLTGFLDFWQESIEGPLHEVRVLFPQGIISPEITIENRGFSIQY